MKRYIWIILTILAVISWLIFFFSLWDKKDHDTHTDQHAEVVADHDTLQAHDVDYRRVIDSLSISNYRLDSAVTSLKQGQATTRKQLDLKTAEARELAKEVQRHNKDTSEQGRRIDSLVELVENYAFLLSQYEAYTDSINNINDSLKINQEAKDKEKDKRIAELQSAYDKLYADYIVLDASSYILKRDLKRQKLKTKIAALLAGGAAVLGLIK